MIQNLNKIEKSEGKIFWGISSINRLNEIGLQFSDFEKTFQNAHRECKELSYHNPYSLEKYSKLINSSIRNFRDIMLNKGWCYNDSNNLNKSFPPDKSYTLIFSSGDENVGNKYKIPTTKNSKGEATIRVLSLNRQLKFQIDGYLPIKSDTESPSPYWFCLFHKNGNKINVEISLAEGFDEKNRKINTWTERIILPEIEFNPNYENKFNNIFNETSCYNKEKELNITRKNK